MIQWSECIFRDLRDYRFESPGIQQDFKSRGYVKCLVQDDHKLFNYSINFITIFLSSLTLQHVKELLVSVSGGYMRDM